MAMEISQSALARLWLYAFLLGVGLGAVYDALRILRVFLGVSYSNRFSQQLKEVHLPLLPPRRATRPSRWLPVVIFVQDVLFGVVGGVGIVILFYWFNNGKIRIPAMLATLGINELLTGICIVMTGGSAYSSFPKQMTDLIAHDIWGVLPVRLLVFIVVAVVIWFMLEKTSYGTKLRLLGTGEKVAIYSGMKTVNMYVRTHMTSSICAAIGGLLMLGTYASARADYGSQYTLQTILIIVLGGVSPVGGKGKMSGVILAIFVLKMLEAGINRFPQISSYYISLIWGGVLILAMVLDYITGDKRARG